MNDAVVCMPRLGLGALFALRARRRGRFVVYVDLLPRWAKVLTRWCRVPEGRLFAFVSRCTGLDVRSVSPVDNSASAAPLRLEGMKRVVGIVEDIGDGVLDDGWSNGIAQVVGVEGARAFFKRRFPWDDVWPFVRAVATTRAAVGDDTPLEVAWHPTWPEQWASVVDEHLEPYGAVTVHWPSWFVASARRATNLAYAARTVALVAGEIARHRVARTERQRATVAIEFADANRLGGGPSDTNFLEDDERLPRDQLLLWVSPHQERVLRRSGLDPRREIQRARAAGFRILRLADARFRPESARLLLGATLPVRRGNAALAHSAWRAWREIATTQLLFDAASPEVVLHAVSPDGVIDSRYGEGILTGLARRTHASVFGYQNRATYDRVIESCFMNYDAYLAWGEGWLDVLGTDATRHYGRIHVVGCTHNDGRAEVSPPAEGHRPEVVVFTNEMANPLFPIQLIHRFLHACMTLASDHPEATFRVKVKDPEQVDALLQDAELRAHLESVERNFTFLRLARHDTAAVIDSADIVVAAAWTTPGTDALLLGKRVLFYNELGSGGQAFAHLPDMIAESEAELRKLFDIACDDYRVYASRHAAVLDRLDPFRDGRARSRALDAVLATLRT